MTNWVMQLLPLLAWHEMKSAVSMARPPPPHVRELGIKSLAGFLIATACIRAFLLSEMIIWRMKEIFVLY